MLKNKKFTSSQVHNLTTFLLGALFGTTLLHMFTEGVTLEPIIIAVIALAIYHTVQVSLVQKRESIKSQVETLMITTPPTAISLLMLSTLLMVGLDDRKWAKELEEQQRMLMKKEKENDES